MDLVGQVHDLLIVGGGIVGAGVARDAAMRGLRVALIDQFDFAHGTSSRSSRLVHGGLRYLAQGRLRLVREASREKAILQRVAPHLVEPLAFIFPARRGSSWPKWKLRLGVQLYDRLCGGHNLGRSEMLDVGDLRRRLPELDLAGVTGGVRYYDGMTNDARLVLDTLRSAHNHGAVLRNYVHFEQAERHGNVWNCALRDTRSNTRLHVQTRSLVNATGPWSSRLAQSHVKLRLTKGVHLVVDRQRLPIPDAVVVPDGDRILFAIPWAARVILGTTDTDYAGPLDDPLCDRDDAQYVLDVFRKAFPALALNASDVKATWAGLRPLVADARGRPSDVSRRHQITMSEPGWWDVTGGKLTTYRLIGEQTVDSIARWLGGRLPASATAQRPLVEPSDTEGVSGILPPPVSRGAVAHYCAREWAEHLDDVMVRRASWHAYVENPLAVATQVAGWMGESLGWDEATRQQQLRRYGELVLSQASALARS
jgi:glycerol-3-phosphate dehydrogenase